MDSTRIWNDYVLLFVRHEGIVRILCDLGAHEMTPMYTALALKNAAQKGHEGIVRIMCDLGTHEIN